MEGCVRVVGMVLYTDGLVPAMFDARMASVVYTKRESGMGGVGAEKAGSVVMG